MYFLSSVLTSLKHQLVIGQNAAQVHALPSVIFIDILIPSPLAALRLGFLGCGGLGRGWRWTCTSELKRSAVRQGTDTHRMWVHLILLLVWLAIHTVTSGPQVYCWMSGITLIQLLATSCFELLLQLNLKTLDLVPGLWKKVLRTLPHRSVIMPFFCFALSQSLW